MASPRPESTSSGRANTTGPLRPDMATWKAWETYSGKARRVLDLSHPFGDGPEHGAVVDLLERLAIDHRTPDLADQQHHRGRILKRRMHANAGMGSHRGRA